MKIALYISGHGYGHATRVMEVARAIRRAQPDVQFVVRSAIPEWLVRLNLGESANYEPVRVDVGVIQRDSYHPDRLATLQAAAELWETSDELIERESQALREEHVDAVLADLPALAFEIAPRAGVPAIGMGNFSWDWIYEPYAEEYPQYRWVVDRIRAAYARCPLLLRLPFHGGLTAFPRALDIPMVARHAERDPQEIRRAIGLENETRPIVLVALRLEDMRNVNWAAVERNCGAYRFVAFQQIEMRDAVVLPPDFVRFQELVNASDIMVSKPGYGIVSECIANRKPLLYTERFDFREYPVLVRGLEEYGWSHCIPHADFLAGRWQPHLERILEKTRRPPRAYQTNGAEVAARIILDQVIDRVAPR